MNKRNIIKSINETLMELPRRTYFWNRKLPRLKTIDEITSKEILIEVYGLKYPVTRKKGIFYEVFLDTLLGFCKKVMSISLLRI